MRLVCELAAPFVANSAVDGAPVIRPFRIHTEACLRCQARHVAMTKTARELRSLAGERYQAPADLEWRVMSSLEGDLALSKPWRATVAVAAVLISAAALLFWRLKPRTSATG